MIPTYTSQELEYFELSPRDNVTDHDPLEYIAVVKASLEAGKLDEYSLLELQNVEKKLSQTYSSLSDEQIRDYEGILGKTFTDIITLQNVKEDEEHKSIDEALSFLNKSVDTYDADAPEYKARKYVGTMRNDLAAGKFDTYTSIQLREVGGKIQDAYSSLSPEEQKEVKDFWFGLYDQITDLQMEKGEIAVEGLIREYYDETKNNPQSWDGCETGKYKRPVVEVTLEDDALNIHEDIDLFGQGSVELLLANVPIAPQEEVSPGKYTPKQPYEEEFTLDALLGKGIVSPTASPSFKAYIDPKKKVSEVMEASSLDNVQDIVARYDLFAHLEDLSKIGTSIPASIPEKNLEAVVIPFPAKKKNKVLNHAAKAAFVAVAGLAAVVGYNYLPSWFNFAADEALSHSHEEAAAVTIPITKTRDHIKNRYVKCTDQDTVEKKRDIKPIVIPVTVTAKAPEKKLVEEDIYAQLDVPPEDIYADLESQEDIYAGLDLVGGEDYHLQYHIQPGDTIFGLWKQYAAEGGPIAFTDYLKDVKKENPILKNPDKIWAGEELRFPSLD